MTRSKMALKDCSVKAEDAKWRPARVQNRFLVLRKLGQGTYGKVQLALNKETNEEVAIKTIKKAKIENEEDMLRIRREIQIMSSIRHPHIIHINEVFETKQKIVLVMQYASGGELYDYLGCHHTLPEDEARRIFRQIASAIYYCHKNKICHRDLKLENILLDEEGNAQIADFGLSNIFDERRRMNTFCGSPLYASPEIVRGTPYKGPEVDCWSLGVLLYTLIYGTMPFDGRNFKELVSQISEGRYEEPVNKSSASGLIRRLLTPEISKRATIFDVCIDRWVNQGCVEPLVKIAEKMTSEALLKTRKIAAPKMHSESTNEIQEKALLTPTLIQQNKENIIVNGEMAELKCVQSEVSQKASLFEQMLKYDVNFVMNQLLSAVECFNPMININDKDTSQGENLTSALKTRNGENTGKVESAYVIPIFEVTSIMPKLTSKNTKNCNCEKSSQMCFTQNITTNEPELHSISGNKNKPKTKKLPSNINQPPSTLTNGKPIQNGVEHSNLANNFEKENNKNKNTFITSKASIENNQAKLLSPNENMLPRLPSIKMKKTYENHLLFGPKKPFFRSKNHSLSLARIFSMKYEKLVLDALKVPERKQKPPGKITIPATFDPSTSCDETPERKEILLLFPTVSVSENKEKIEKKIDKIKKAALNMNLIRRSNTNNRLRIQKFLRSQAKKMQDLVCDEHRSLAGSMEYIDQISGFPTNFCTFEKGTLNPLSVKQHNKKINFMNSNLSNINPFAFHISHGEKWKLFGSENILTDDKENLAVFGISKSKSDIQFPTNYSEYTMTNSSYRSSYSSGYNSLSNTLSVPNSDCSLLRSASDSDGLNFFRNTPTMCTNKEYFKCTEGNISNVHYHYENDKIDKSFSQNESGKSRKTSEGKEIQNITNSDDFSQNVEMDAMNIHPDVSSNLNCLNNKNKENYTIRRSISSINCSNSQKITASDLQNIKRLLLTPSLIHKKNNQAINNGSKYIFPLHANVLGGKKIMEEDKKCLRRTSLVGEHPNENISLTWNEIKSMGSDEIFNNYLWMPPGKQELLTLYQQKGGKCLSSPNLADSDLEKNINFKNDGTVIDGFYIKSEENDDFLDFASINKVKNLQKSMKKLTQSNQGLHISDSVDEAFYDYSPRYKKRAMSINDESLINLESLLEYERKLSLPQGSLGKTPFLSKFLNDLERREHPYSNMDNSSSHNQRPSQKKTFKPPKRSKFEKRSQSFLQLLALKRIKEAEKELEKVERSNRIEDEDEPGSLLEALKTHGYKGVISQRFQNQDDDDDAMLPLNRRNPRSQFLARNFSPDMSYMHTMDYDTSPYIYSPYEDDDIDLEMLNGVTMRSLYEMYPGYKQNFPKQYIYDWLTSSQDNEYSTSLRTDPVFESEIPNISSDSETPSYWSKESPSSFEEAFSSESFQFPKDQIANGTSNIELNPARYNSTDNDETSNYVRHNRNQLFRTPSAPERYEDYSKYPSIDRNLSADNDEFSNYVRTERNPLLRTASAPEEEKEESVQDRIWRKSFYSRFNNSVLSRKERTSFLDTCDSRAGFRERSLTPFKITSRDRLDRSGSNVLQSKRISKRRSSSSSDRTLDSGLSTSMKHIPLERTPTNVTLTNETDETDPEH